MFFLLLCLTSPQGHRSRSLLCRAVVSLGEGVPIFFCCAGLAGRGLYTWGKVHCQVLFAITNREAGGPRLIIKPFITSQAAAQS